MREPEVAERLIGAALGAVDVPVTVKMRLGWDDASKNAPDIAARAEALGVAAVTVHGRTRCQFYKGAADWSGGARGQGRRLDPGDRQRRHHRRRFGPKRADGLGGGWRDGSAAASMAGPGSPRRSKRRLSAGVPGARREPLGWRSRWTISPTAGGSTATGWA